MLCTLYMMYLFEWLQICRTNVVLKKKKKNEESVCRCNELIEYFHYHCYIIDGGSINCDPPLAARTTEVEKIACHKFSQYEHLNINKCIKIRKNDDDNNDSTVKVACLSAVHQCRSGRHNACPKFVRWAQIIFPVLHQIKSRHA